MIFLLDKWSVTGRKFWIPLWRRDIVYMDMMRGGRIFWSCRNFSHLWNSFWNICADCRPTDTVRLSESFSKTDEPPRRKGSNARFLTITGSWRPDCASLCSIIHHLKCSVELYRLASMFCTLKVTGMARILGCCQIYFVVFISPSKEMALLVYKCCLMSQHW